LAASLAVAILLPTTLPPIGLSAADEAFGSRWRSEGEWHVSKDG
jgi:hypothetical protein